MIHATIVFVNYRDYDGLRSVLSQAVPPGLRVVIADNTEDADRDERALAEWEALEGVRVARTDNPGYLGAARAVQAAGLIDANCDAVIVSNTDISIDFVKLVEELDRHGSPVTSDGVGMIAPALLDSNGSLARRQQHYLSRPSSAHFDRLARVFGNYWVAVGYRALGDIKRRLVRGRQPSPGEQVFAPHGSFMIFTREYMSRTSGFDFPSFLFCEEIFVGLETARAGLACIYDPRFQYKHDGHRSMGRGQSRRVIRYLQESHEWAARALSDAEALEGSS